MATKSAQHTSATDTTSAVDAFLATLDHPFKAEIQAMRAALLGADRSIAEGIKWNAPSYRTKEYFATTNLREKTGIGLLKWLAKDRAMIVFEDMTDFRSKKAAFVGVIRAWIAHV